VIRAGRCALRSDHGRCGCFASSRDGEETLLLDALKSMRKELGSDPILLVVPRHPQRFRRVARLIEARGFVCARRSAGAFTAPPANGTILLGDSMGEMAMYYAAPIWHSSAAVCCPSARKNLIEACAVGTPVLLGRAHSTSCRRQTTRSRQVPRCGRERSAGAAPRSINFRATEVRARGDGGARANSLPRTAARPSARGDDPRRADRSRLRLAYQQRV